MFLVNFICIIKHTHSIDMEITCILINIQLTRNDKNDSFLYHYESFSYNILLLHKKEKKSNFAIIINNLFMIRKILLTLWIYYYYYYKLIFNYINNFIVSKHKKSILYKQWYIFIEIYKIILIYRDICPHSQVYVYFFSYTKRKNYNLRKLN